MTEEDMYEEIGMYAYGEVDCLVSVSLWGIYEFDINPVLYVFELHPKFVTWMTRPLANIIVNGAFKEALYYASYYYASLLDVAVY